MTQFILGIDQGTSSTRAIILNSEAQLIAQHQIEFKQYFPKSGWVEHDPEEIWQSVVNCCNAVLAKTNLSAQQIAGVGISNQRETTIIWDKKTGEAIYPAIVWQDRRTSEFCQRLKKQPAVAKNIRQKTGLLIDPYFSATKIAWILDHVPNARKRAKKGELAFGTIDSFLLWRFTKGLRHVTDITNASRTLLFNIHTQEWDEEFLRLFNIPLELLPTVLENNSLFGKIDASYFSQEIPITGVAGDQQAATIGQACFEPGMIKATYGTGCFVVLNTGKKSVSPPEGLLTTIIYRINQKTIYGLEGSIFIAGAAIQWLRDKLHLIKHARECEQLMNEIESNEGVYLIPAFTGLGAPYWKPDVRGAIFGLTRDTGICHIVRATLEAVCYQTKDLLELIVKNYQQPLTKLRVDGGMVANDTLLQFLSDLLQLPVERPKLIESSVIGASLLAGLGAGIFSSLEEISNLYQADKIFTPVISPEKGVELYAGWQTAVQRMLGINR